MRSILVHIHDDECLEARLQAAFDLAHTFDGHLTCAQAVDFDDASRTAIDCAQRFGILERTQVAALHLFDAPASGMMKRAMQMPEAIDHYIDSERAEARNKLDAFLSAANVRNLQRLVEYDHGSAARMILSCAEEQGADLIVMGTNQRKGVRRFLLGSVAQNVLLDAKCDVLVVPASIDAKETAGT